MTNTSIDTGSGKAGPYSHGIKSGDLIFVSGQIGDKDPDTGKMASQDVEVQTLQTLNKLKKIVEAGGGTVANIAKMTVFLKNIKDFSKMNAVYEKFFKDNGVTSVFPARSTIEANLAFEEILVEIDCFAVL